MKNLQKKPHKGNHIKFKRIDGIKRIRSLHNLWPGHKLVSNFCELKYDLSRQSMQVYLHTPFHQAKDITKISLQGLTWNNQLKPVKVNNILEIEIQYQKRKLWGLTWAVGFPTPNVKVEIFELRKVTSPSTRSEYRSEKNTRYSDIIVIKTAWVLDIPLQKKVPINKHAMQGTYKMV